MTCVLYIEMQPLSKRVIILAMMATLTIAYQDQRRVEYPLLRLLMMGNQLTLFTSHHIQVGTR